MHTFKIGYHEEEVDWTIKGGIFVKLKNYQIAISCHSTYSMLFYLLLLADKEMLSYIIIEYFPKWGTYIGEMVLSSSQMRDLISWITTEKASFYLVR